MTDDLRAQLAALDSELSKTPWAKKQRRRQAFVTFLVTIDLLTTLGFGLLVNNAKHQGEENRRQNAQTRVLLKEVRALALRIEKNSESVHDSCEAFNNYILQDKARWGGIASDPKFQPPNETPAQKRQRAENTALFLATFKTHPCPPKEVVKLPSEKEAK